MKRILDGSNSSTSPLETMHIEITFASKYWFALGEVALEDVRNMGEECFP
jgi:hypothetical protein